MTPKITRDAEGLSLMNGRQTIKLASADTEGKLAVILSVIPAGSGIPPHVHLHEDELFQVLDGQLELYFDGKVTLLNKGDLAFLPKNIPHGFKALFLTTMWVSLFPAGGEKMFMELAELPPGPPDREKIAIICQRYGVTFLQ